MIKNWTKAVLPLSATLREVLAVIDEQALRIVLIADDELRLLGTVTDGDLREVCCVAWICHQVLSW